jgi:hypothetical protein
VGRSSIIFGICVVLAGCASTGGGQQMNLADAKQIRPGVTDKAGVERVLGVPTSRSTAPNSEEVWLYSRGNAAVALVSFGSQEGSGQEVQVYFRKNIVSRCWIRASSATAASDAPAESAAPASTLTDCREPPKHRATAAAAPPAAAPAAPPPQ